MGFWKGMASAVSLKIENVRALALEETGEQNTAESQLTKSCNCLRRNDK